MSEPKTKEMAAANEAALLDQLLAGCEKPEDLLAPGGAFNRLKKRLIERLLGSELSVHLGYAKGQKAMANDGNHRNGYSAKDAQAAKSQQLPSPLYGVGKICVRLSQLPFDEPPVGA